MMRWTDGFADLDNISIHYWRTDGLEKDRPPVVLLHGMTDSGACWKEFVQYYGDDSAFLAPDARGHGRSSAPQRGNAYEEHARDIIGLLQALRIERPVLIGHSMGGVTAALVASQIPCRALILEDPAFFEENGRRPIDADAWIERHRQILRTPLDEVEADGARRHPRWSKMTVAAWAEAKHATRLAAFDVLKETSPTAQSLLPKIEAPTHLVIGDPDRGAIISPSFAQALAALHPRLTVERIEDASHCIRFDRPAEFAAAVRAFLERIAYP